MASIEPPPPHLMDLANKRWTLNVLMQGAAVNSCLSAHHWVRKDIDALDPDMIQRYDQFAAMMAIKQWCSVDMMFAGFPYRYWQRIHRPDHPLHHHGLLRRHGDELMRASRDYAYEQARRRRVRVRIPFLYDCNIMILLYRIMWRERQHRDALVDLATRTVADTWGIERGRLNAALTLDVAFGSLREPKTTFGKLYRAGAVGYGGVVNDAGQLSVVARSFIVPLVMHELVKGTVELVCLHALGGLDDDTYDELLDATDHIEFEDPHMMVGPELWRRFVKAIPTGMGLGSAVMHTARLAPDDLDAFMADVIENTPHARRRLTALAEQTARRAQVVEWD